MDGKGAKGQAKEWCETSGMAAACRRAVSFRHRGRLGNRSRAAAASWGGGRRVVLGRVEVKLRATQEIRHACPVSCVL